MTPLEAAVVWVRSGLREPPCDRVAFRASVFFMMASGSLHPYPKYLLHIFLLAFVVFVSGGTASADFNGPETRENACISVKAAFDAPTTGFSKSPQVFHPAPTFILQVLTGRPVFALHHSPQHRLFDLNLATPSRAPPVPSLS